MIRFDRFPEGKTHAIVFSFDDGKKDDLRLAKLLDDYGLKGTFHLNSGNLDKDDYLTINQVCELTNNHEVAIHGENHARLINCSSPTIIREIINDRIFFEEKTEKITTGFSYPYGDVNNEIINVARSCGVNYARTTKSTHQFSIPDNFLLWNPTCHMYEAKDDVSLFMNKLTKLGQNPLLLIWGHSFELERDNQWDEIEKLFGYISNHEEIWYATCGEIYAYIEATRKLRISADETIVENPSSRSVWISYNKAPVEIRGGECVKLR